MDARHGSVLATASFPTYPLDWWVGGISSANYDYLTDPTTDPKVSCSDRPHACPLVDRATQGVYAPGSTFKLVTSLAMTKYGIRSVGEYFTDNGSVRARRHRVPQRGRRGVRAGEPPAGAHRLERHVLLHGRRRVLARRGRAATPSAGSASRREARELGFGAATGYRARRGRRVASPIPKWKQRFADANYKTEGRTQRPRHVVSRSTTSSRRSARATSSSRRCSSRTRTRRSRTTARCASRGSWRGS